MTGSHTTVLRRFGLTVAVMDFGFVILYLALGKKDALAGASIAATAVVVFGAMLGGLAIREGGWYLFRLADDWAAPVAAGFRWPVRIAAYLFMIGILVATFYIISVLLGYVLPGRAARA